MGRSFLFDLPNIVDFAIMRNLNVYIIPQRYGNYKPA